MNLALCAIYLGGVLNYLQSLSHHNDRSAQLSRKKKKQTKQNSDLLIEFDSIQHSSF